MVDPAFTNPTEKIGKQAGMWVWRIEAMKVVPLPKDQYGTFFRGDSYICLKSTQLPASSTLEHHIFFWLGSETSNDEKGVAAYKTVELDDYMGGTPVQHRETEGHESQEFLALFPKINFKDGGVASGFKKVEKKEIKQLYQVKGKRTVTVRPVPTVTKSLNAGDVFILDVGSTIYVWNGDEASKTEKIKGMQHAQSVNTSERGGSAKLIVIEQKDKGENVDNFFKVLGGRGAIAAATDDAAEEARLAKQLSLYEVSNASGSMKTTKVAGGDLGPLKREQLNSKDVFIVDCAAGLFVWIGKQADKEEKSKGMLIAQDFIKEKGYPDWTAVTKVSDGAETSIFQNQFLTWPNKTPANPNKRADVGKKVDAGSLHTQKQREKQKMADDGTGQLKVWRVEDFKPVPVPESSYGEFFTGDCYVCEYTYVDKSTNPPREAILLYFWQGNDSTTDEKGASALITKEMDDAKGGLPVQVRVVQNKEPDHFLLLFKGKFIIRMGGKGSGFKSATGAAQQKDNYDTDGTSLYHIRGTTELNTKAVQVEEVAESLNSNDCFVLEKPKEVYCWMGKFCTPDERLTCEHIAERLAKGRPVTKAMEGMEKDDFWAAIGGKDGYKLAERRVETSKEPRLFQCSNASGHFQVEELIDFVQEDLDEEDVFLLDTWDNVFIWVGEGANVEEKKKSLEIAMDYLKADGTRKPDDVPILTVKQGFEPPMFTSCFIWDAVKARNNTQDYEKIKAAMMASGGSGVTSATAELAKFSAKHSYATLKTRPLPEGVDPSKLEDHLEDSEFESVFKMDRQAFNAMPKWKASNLKKSLGLF